MTDERVALALEIVETEARHAISFVEGLGLADFLEDELARHAVAMCLIVIGENVGKLELMRPDIFASARTTDWRNIVGMRNRIAHGYHGLNFQLVWETVTRDLPLLLKDIPDLKSAD